MGTVNFESLFGHRVYIDTNVFIYFLDGQNPFLSVAVEFLQFVVDGHIIGYAGDAVIAETMVHPYRQGNITQIERFHAFFRQENFLTICPHNAETFRWASQIAGERNMKLIDSLHIATALQANCSYLVTYDRGIKEIPDLKIIQLGQFVKD